jgi:hypothetical protein
MHVNEREASDVQARDARDVRCKEGKVRKGCTCKEGKERGADKKGHGINVDSCCCINKQGILRNGRQ